jgi:hypothetical protein
MIGACSARRSTSLIPKIAVADVAPPRAFRIVPARDSCTAAIGGRFRTRPRKFTLLASNVVETLMDALSSTMIVQPERMRGCRRIT